MKKKYKTLHISGEILDYVCGGIGSVINKLYEKKTDDECFILCRYQEDGNTVEGREIAKDVYEYSLGHLIDLEELDIMVDKNIFIHNVSLLGLPNLKTNAKKIMVVHGFDGVNEDVIVKSYVNCDEIVGVSFENIKKIKNIVMKFFNNNPVIVASKKHNVIYNGVDLEKNIDLDINENKKIGFIGRYHPIKAISPLILQMKYIPNYYLYIAGGDANYQWNTYVGEVFRSIVFSNNKKIIPIGYVSDERKINFFKNMDIIIIPSFYEGLSITLLEAISCGKMIFSNNIESVKEVLGNDYPFYFNINEEGSLERLVKKYEGFTKQEKIDILRKNYNKFVDVFSSDVMVEEYRKYESDSFYKYIQYGINLI